MPILMYNDFSFLEIYARFRVYEFFDFCEFSSGLPFLDFEFASFSSLIFENLLQISSLKVFRLLRV